MIVSSKSFIQQMTKLRQEYYFNLFPRPIYQIKKNSLYLGGKFGCLLGENFSLLIPESEPSWPNESLHGVVAKHKVGLEKGRG